MKKSILTAITILCIFSLSINSTILHSQEHALSKLNADDINSTEKTSNNMVEYEIDVMNINKIVASGVAKVIYTQTVNKSTVKVKTNNELKEFVDIKEKNGVLNIGIKDAYKKDKAIKKIPYIKFIIEVSSPWVKSVSMNGTSSFHAENLKINSSNLEILGGGASEIKIRSIETKDLKIKLNGSSSIKSDNLKINSSNLELDGSGASEFKIGSITTREFKIKLGGASVAESNKVTADKANIALEGSSSLDISQLVVKRSTDMNLSGSSEINIKDGATKDAKVNMSGASIANLYKWDIKNIDLTTSGASEISYNGLSKVVSKSTSGVSKISTKK